MVAPEDRFAGSSKKKSSQAAQHTKRRVRTKFKPYQIERLESSFEEAKYPTSAQRSQLARDLALTDLCVQVRHALFCSTYSCIDIVLVPKYYSRHSPGIIRFLHFMAY